VDGDKIDLDYVGSVQENNVKSGEYRGSELKRGTEANQGDVHNVVVSKEAKISLGYRSEPHFFRRWGEVGGGVGQNFSVVSTVSNWRMAHAGVQKKGPKGKQWCSGKKIDRKKEGI